MIMQEHVFKVPKYRIETAFFLQVVQFINNLRNFFTVFLGDLCEGWGNCHCIYDQSVGYAELVVVIESANKNLIVGGQGNSAHRPCRRELNECISHFAKCQFGRECAENDWPDQTSANATCLFLACTSSGVSKRARPRRPPRLAKSSPMRPSRPCSAQPSENRWPFSVSNTIWFSPEQHEKIVEKRMAGGK